MSAQLTGWGTDKDTYARGDTAIGWIYVLNTGNVPIDRVDIKVVVSRMIFFYRYSKEYDYSPTGLGIQPGENRRIEFNVLIPAEYQGISTAGDYNLDATVSVGGKQIGSFSKGMKVV